MATVYVAHDLRHGRPVALKVLHPELASAVGAERFLREIRLTAHLQHPHILPVLDSGQANGLLWYTMPYVEGESLRQRLSREAPLPLELALEITRQVAAALSYAHVRGVVHRDIKPENILLADDQAVLGDFGVAQAVSAAGSETITEPGLTVGTPAYMSPEQACGGPLDARSDIYSLACVLYEMLVAHPPFLGATGQEVMARHVTQPAPSVRTASSALPGAVEQAVARALAKTPADRWATASEFTRALQTPPPAIASELTPPVVAPSTAATRGSPPLVGRPRRLVGAITLGLAVLLGLGVLLAWHLSHRTAMAIVSPRVVAVLPFENVGDSADAYFADGITDEVRTKLSKLGGLQVIARSSSNEYRHTTKTLEEIARELEVDYLLSGTVRWEKVPGGASRVRVLSELVELAPGRAPWTRWADQFEAAPTDIFGVQTELAGKVAHALNVVLAASTRRQLAARPTHSLAAYEAFLKGEAASQRMVASDPPSLRLAVGFYEQAVAIDSAFVSAWAQLARAHAVLYVESTPTPTEATLARQAGERARTLAPNRPEGYLALGEYFRLVRVDNPQALEVLEAGLRLEPNNADLLTEAARSESSLGRWEAALPRLARAVALDPRSAKTAREYAYSLLVLRRYSEAEVAYDRALALAPTDLNIILRRAMVALAEGDLARAQAGVRAALKRVEPAALLAFFAQGEDLYWVLDDPQQRQVLGLAPSAFDNQRGAWGLVRAQIYHLRGDTARARVYADSARLALAEQLRASPQDPMPHALLGLALAYLGRKVEAIREGQRGVALMPISQDAQYGSYIQHQLARVYVLVGEPEKALDQLDPLLKIPNYLSPDWLRIDPNFAPLRSNPRFERLVAQ